MIAMLVLVIALFALISIQTHSMRAQRSSKTRHQATLLLSSYMAQAEASLQEDFGTDVSRVLSSDASHPEFQIEISVTDGALTDLKQIKGRVVWREGRGELSSSLESKVADID